MLDFQYFFQYLSYFCTAPTIYPLSTQPTPYFTLYSQDEHYEGLQLVIDKLLPPSSGMGMSMSMSMRVFMSNIYEYMHCHVSLICL